MCHFIPVYGYLKIKILQVKLLTTGNIDFKFKHIQNHPPETLHQFIVPLTKYENQYFLNLALRSVENLQF